MQTAKGRRQWTSGKPPKESVMTLERAESESEAVIRAARTAIDPVCGIAVTISGDALTDVFGGDDYYFCSQGCHAKFSTDPWFYASGRAEGRKKVAPADTRFTCPMHPLIVRDMPARARSAAWRWSRWLRPTRRARN
jgi:YHS domain-containing protein